VNGQLRYKNATLKKWTLNKNHILKILSYSDIKLGKWQIRVWGTLM
jgi:hypothetical protein